MNSSDDATDTGATRTRSNATNLRKQAASGARWGIINQLIQQSTKFVVQVVLARVLAPQQFGIMATALIVVNLGQLLNGLGFGPALVHRKHLTEAHVRAAFTGTLLLGAGFTAASYFGAGALARFFEDDQLESVLQVLSLIFLLKAVESVPNDMLRRDLRFREFVLSSSVAAVVSAVVSVIAAIAGAGIWALVIYAMVDAAIAATLACVLGFRAGVWRPALTLDWPATRDLTSYSLYVTVARFFTYVQMNGDNFAVSKVLGQEAVGIYNQAYRLFLFPIQKVSLILGQVAFPTFAAVQDDPVRLRRGFLRGIQYTSSVTVPLSLGMCVTAPYLVPTLLGPRWEPSVVPLQILALTGPRAALVQLNSNIWQAIGKPQWSLATSLVMGPFTIVGVIIGLDHGVNGVATGVAIAAYVALPQSLWLAARAIESSVWTILRTVAPVFASALLMSAVTWGVGAGLGDGISDLLRLVAMGAAGAVTYVAALSRFDRTLVGEIADQFIGPIRAKRNRTHADSSDKES